MISYIGKIFWNRNVIFKMTGSNKVRQIDHAKKRPVLVIAENEDYFYYLTITSKIGESTLPIPIINKHGEYKNSFVSVSQIYKKPMCFIKSIQTIENEKLLETFIMLKKYNEKIKKDEYYDEIKDEIDKLIVEYSIFFDKKTKKLKLK